MLLGRLNELLIPDPAMPARHRRSRARGASLPAGTTCVTRGTRWGNPFKVGEMVHIGPDWRPGQVRVRDRPRAVRLYRDWLLGHRDRCQDLVPELAGRALACWCELPQPGQPDWCHARLLIVLANK